MSDKSRLMDCHVCGGREIERLQLTCNDLDDQNDRIYAELAALKAQPSGVVPAALGSAFITCESGDAGYRVVIKSETLQEAQQLHNWLARLNQPASSNTIDLVFDGELPNAVFVEAEDGDGNSINAGHWFQREDGYLVLRISSVECQPTQKESDAAAHRYLAQVNKTKPASAGDERDALRAQLSSQGGEAVAWREHSVNYAKGEKCPETIETLQAAWDRDQELINDMRHEIARHKTRINRLEQRRPTDQVAEYKRLLDLLADWSSHFTGPKVIGGPLSSLRERTDAALLNGGRS